MKKLCISIIMAVLILAVCFVIGCSCSQESPTDLVKAEALASKQHAKLVEFLKESSGANIYDDGLDLNLYYGGSYLDDEKRLTICCTTEDNLIVEAFREAAGSPYVAVKYVKFTKEELDSLKEEFAGLLKAYKVDEELDEKEMKLVNDIMGYGVDVFTNQIRVSIRELDSDKEELFNDLFDIFPIDCVRLEEGHKMTTTLR